MLINAVLDLNGRKVSTTFEAPDHCPVCRHGIQPNHLLTKWTDDHRRLEAVFGCPRKVCQTLFIGVYRDRNFPAMDWKLDALSPYSVETPTYPDPISKVSPRFVEIMRQVSIAESKQLDQLVGMGLRKAIEFLIKDFCIQEHSGQEANIKKGELAWVIGQYIKDGYINACAKRATWLGNDETHYERRWMDKDITNLKDLVRLTVIWIESHELTKEYRKEMPDPVKT